MALPPVNVLMVGTGEYTTGYTGATNVSDKSLGVVALVMFDCRSRGKVANVSMVGTTGKKHGAIREHLANGLGRKYKNMDVSVQLFPDDAVERDADAYKGAIDQLEKGDAVIIFTPDDTHFDIALYAVKKGMHVLVTKPAVKTAEEHRILVEEAEKQNVLVAVELHKRFDPIYADAREKMRTLGDFSYFNAYMSQPKYQLTTFKAWAGKSSDISYYLNSHHIDVLTWALQGVAVPISVTASAATGVASSEKHGCAPGTEDTITLLVTFRNIASGNTGTAVFTSSWIAPKAEVHTQQRFFYMGHSGEIRVDQAHRGYESATDSNGFGQNNPLYIRYQPDPSGKYVGQYTYGHRSLEAWIDAVQAIKAGKATPSDYVGSLATAKETEVITKILEAGRKSLDQGGTLVKID
ncbi:hypothetical protein DFJ73DRAFT_628353 [Zopfochytrium polystomum]|nr:hypothetical protein DFJ73DRAFT_628353 [Zopfochytrium polystomum]